MVWHIKRASKFNPKLLCWNRTDSNHDLSQPLVDLFYKYVSSAIESTFFSNELDNTYNDFTYNDFTYNDFAYNDFTYNDFTYNDFTYNDFIYNDLQ